METIVVLLIVATAAGFIVRRAVRAVASSRKSAGGCGTCGCGDGKEVAGR